MRIQRFVYVLLILLCSCVIANAENLVDTEIPSLEDVNSKPHYLNPTLQTTNAAIQKSNSLVSFAERLDNEGRILILQRDAAKIAAFGPDDQWKGKLINFAFNVVAKNVLEPFKDFLKSLLDKKDRLEREQAYAEKCQEVNNHYKTVHDAKVMADSMHPIAKIIRDRYKAQNSQTYGLYGLEPLPSITIPAPVNPRWRCKGKGFGTGLSDSLLKCLDTWYYPKQAYSKHRVACGGTNDPNSSVAGCVRIITGATRARMV